METVKYTIAGTLRDFSFSHKKQKKGFFYNNNFQMKSQRILNFPYSSGEISSGRLFFTRHQKLTKTF